MTSFQEFLHKKAEEQKRGFRPDRRDEWIAAVDKLNRQIVDWLRESDPEQLLEIIPETVEKAEKGLGTYRVPALKIGVGNRMVRVVPIARNLVNPLLGDGTTLGGRVDITDGSKKYMLRRILRDSSPNREGPDEAPWEVLDEHFGVTPLDRGRLESILQDLLS